MEFGKVAHPSSIDFSLPANHQGTLKVLGNAPSGHPKIHIGCPVWGEDGFAGKIYPAKAKPKDYLKHYSNQYNSIELNITHYKIPDADTIQHWCDVTPAGFKFCPKVNQLISHTPYLTQNAPMMREFLEHIKLFKYKLGLPFFQLPPNYDSTKLDDLLEFLDRSMAGDIAIELRHESWFKNETVLNLFCNYCYKNRITFLITDTSGRRDVLHQRLTTKKAFVRFVANDLHPTDFTRMQAWSERLKLWLDNGLEELYFFIHTPDHSLMPKITIAFIDIFNQKTGMQVKPPKLITGSKPNETLF